MITKGKEEVSPLTLTITDATANTGHAGTSFSAMIADVMFVDDLSLFKQLLRKSRIRTKTRRLHERTASQ
jgi:hypothetical protein